MYYFFLWEILRLTTKAEEGGDVTKAALFSWRIFNKNCGAKQIKDIGYSIYKINVECLKQQW